MAAVPTLEIERGLWADASLVIGMDEVGRGALAGPVSVGALALHAAGLDVASAAILLDGIHDWLAPALRRPIRTTLRATADRDCASVSGAALVAKVERDGRMVEADAVHPGYSWASNKGYGSATHLAAIAELGPSLLHRRTWLHSILQPAAEAEPVPTGRAAAVVPTHPPA